MLNPAERLGSSNLDELKAHPFWQQLPCPFDELYSATPPELNVFLPALAPDDDALEGNLADADIDSLLAKAYADAGVKEGHLPWPVVREHLQLTLSNGVLTHTLISWGKGTHESD